jgi:L-amino acid N-acyltransferase YncA
MDLVIRDVRPEDAETLAAILNSIIATRRFTVLDEPITVAQQREFIQHFSPRGIFLVAEIGSKVIGLQDVEPFATYTRAFDHVGIIGSFVDESARQRGVFKRLCEATFERAPQKGYQKFFTYVRGDNPVALGAYLQQGFEVVGTAKRQARIDGRFIDEVVIEKLL